MNPDLQELVTAARDERSHSYSPYSGFRVGAALRGASGRIYLGTNVENASFGLAICAERSAVVQAVSAGETSFTGIAVCADGPAPTAPCGACRQVLLEFAPDMPVVLAGEDGLAGELIETTVAALMPHAFFDFRDQLQARRDEGDDR
ncbi:cytidine deaminase [bacterium]|nr:cytidine deaminase [bacterium]